MQDLPVFFQHDGSMNCLLAPLLSHCLPVSLSPCLAVSLPRCLPASLPLNGSITYGINLSPDAAPAHAGLQKELYIMSSGATTEPIWNMTTYSRTLFTNSVPEKHESVSVCVRVLWLWVGESDK